MQCFSRAIEVGYKMIQDALIGLTASVPDNVMSSSELEASEKEHLRELGDLLNALPGVGVGGL
jgi:hypothetical protein